MFFWICVNKYTTKEGFDSIHVIAQWRRETMRAYLCYLHAHSRETQQCKRADKVCPLSSWSSPSDVSPSTPCSGQCYRSLRSESHCLGASSIAPRTLNFLYITTRGLDLSVRHRASNEVSLSLRWQREGCPANQYSIEGPVHVAREITPWSHPPGPLISGVREQWLLDVTTTSLRRHFSPGHLRWSRSVHRGNRRLDNRRPQWHDHRLLKKTAG